MFTWLRDRITIWVILGAMAVSGLLIGGLAILLFWLPGSASLSPIQTPAALTVVPAPTLTPKPAIPEMTPTPEVIGQVVDGIGIGMYVQISGTEGDGLRLRAGPGVNNDPRFLGYEAEVFRVIDGPKFNDEFTWWFLEAPYDPGRSGWAASRFLTVVSQNP